MDDPQAVHLIDSASEHLHQPRRIGRGPRRAIEFSGEASPFDVFHREVREAAVLSHRVDLNDVGMLEPRDRLGFDLETCERLWRGEFPGENRLERDRTLEPDFQRFVNNAHASSTELGEDLIAFENRPASRMRAGCRHHGRCLGVDGGGRFGLGVSRASLGADRRFDLERLRDNRNWSHEGGGDLDDEVRKPRPILVDGRVFTSRAAESELKSQKLAEGGRGRRTVRPFEICLNARPFASGPGGLEAVAELIDVNGDGQGHRFGGIARPVGAHAGSSLSQVFLMTWSLRSTVRATHPSAAAISSLV